MLRATAWRGLSQLRRFVLGPLSTNCYIFGHGGDTFVVDPADDARRIIAQVPRGHRGDVLLTHGHFDHIMALPEYLIAHPEAKVFLAREDLPYLADLPWNPDGPGSLQAVSKRFEYVRDGQSIAGINVVSTPGHTPGSVSYFLEEEKVLWSGDTLFRGSVGNCDFAGGDYEKMLESIRTKLLVLPDSTLVLPGHGLDTTILQEKKYNLFLRPEVS